MQDLPRSPNELMPEVTALIPYFIENLGNSKVSEHTAPSQTPVTVIVSKSYLYICGHNNLFSRNYFTI